MSGFGYRNLGFGGGNYVAPVWGEIPNSLRLDGTSAYLTRTPGSAGSRRKWTFSCWIKRHGEDSNNQTLWDAGDESSAYMGFNSDEKFYFVNFRVSTAVFRDFSAWSHVLVHLDTANGTASLRFRVWINGVEITAWDTNTTISQNTDYAYNDAQLHGIGRQGSGGTTYTAGNLAEVHFVNDALYGTSTFGETGDYGEWKAKEVQGVTYGTNGFYLDFKLSADSSSGLGKDQSGNGNDWTPNGLDTTDQMLDSPTNNFATLNPLGQLEDAFAGVLQDGNLSWIQNNGNYHYSVRSTIAVKSGKWYFEGHAATASPNSFQIGIQSVLAGSGFPPGDGSQLSQSNGFPSYSYDADGTKRKNDTTTTDWGDTFTASGDLVGVAIDFDSAANGLIYFYVNGSLTGSTYAYNDIDLSDEWYFAISGYSQDNWKVNFGQDSSFAGAATAQNNADDNGIGDFYYAPPTGFLALCTKNMAAPAVIPSEHFNTVLYTGTGSSLAVTGVGFQPDWTWIKSRTNAYSHYVYDIVRGATNRLLTDTTAAESALAEGLTAFGADGFTVGSDAGANESSDGHVAWNWLAGNAVLGTGDFTQGIIPSTCSRNAAAGFSIVSYSGDASATADGSNNSGAYYNVGHGLSTAPEVIMVKKRSSASGWYMGHIGLGSDVWTAGRHLTLHTTASSPAEANILWGSGTVNSTLFSIGGWDVVNRSGSTYIAYCFHSVDGYSKMGSYTGNGNAIGPFVYTGFRPAWVMVKNTGATGSWWIVDNQRPGYNGTLNTSGHLRLRADTSGVEDDAGRVDTLSNGFKIRTPNYGESNTNNVKYAFMAFAETPMKYANAR